MRKGSATGYEVMRAWTGDILQAGLPSIPAEAHDPMDNTMGFMTPAVVEATYFADQEPRAGQVEGALLPQRNVVCDVRTYGTYSRALAKVPVMQRTQGLWDEDIYIPRPSRQDTDGGDLFTGSAVDGKTPTPAESMDGDHVIVGFLCNNPRFPVILPFTLGHPRSNVSLKSSNGRRRRIRHGGVVLEWSEDGDFTIDASSAAKEELGPGGAEQANHGTAGNILLKTKDGAGATLSFLLDKDGNATLQDGGGTEALTLSKSSGNAELKAAVNAAINSPLVQLSTAPLEPVTKATSLTAQLAVILAVITTYTTLVGTAMDSLVNAQGLSQQDISNVSKAGSGAASTAATGVVNAIGLGSAIWTSTKVTTG